MTGPIIAKHIPFTTGLRSAAPARSGQQSVIRYIAFPAGMPTEALSDQLSQAMQPVARDRDVVFLTDIQAALKLVHANRHCAVITDCNLPLFIENIMEPDNQTDIAAFYYAIHQQRPTDDTTPYIYIRGIL